MGVLCMMIHESSNYYILGMILYILEVQLKIDCEPFTIAINMTRLGCFWERNGRRLLETGALINRDGALNLFL